MKKLLFLAVFATAISFTNGNAAIQKGADCDALFDSTYSMLKEVGFEDPLSGASGVFWSCINTGGQSDRLIEL